MAARKSGMSGRTERRTQSRAEGRRPGAPERVLEVHDCELADAEGDVEKHQVPELGLAIETEQGHPVLWGTVVLGHDLRQVPLAVILHEDLQLIDLTGNEGLKPGGRRLPR